MIGVLLLLVTAFAPTTWDGRHGRPSVFLRLTPQINLLGFFLIVRVRRYFQVSADSLLAVDKRAPVLFLRSFADDERQQYGTSQRVLLDFSLETRLANHFYHFGPFIAIGSPKETVPQPGAARVLLRDDEWQTRVLGWMRDAELIIMYCGKTQWVNWELRRVVESGRATSMILMFPEIKIWRSSRRKQDISARMEHVREVFRDTPWNEELMAFDDFEGLRDAVPPRRIDGDGEEPFAEPGRLSPGRADRAPAAARSGGRRSDRSDAHCSATAPPDESHRGGSRRSRGDSRRRPPLCSGPRRAAHVQERGAVLSEPGHRRRRRASESTWFRSSSSPTTMASPFNSISSRTSTGCGSSSIPRMWTTHSPPFDSE